MFSYKLQKFLNYSSVVLLYQIYKAATRYLDKLFDRTIDMTGYLAF